MSFVVKKGDKYIVGKILFSVVAHFIQFNTIYSYILSVALIANVILIFIKKDNSIFIILSIDAIIKITLRINSIVIH